MNRKRLAQLGVVLIAIILVSMMLFQPASAAISFRAAGVVHNFTGSTVLTLQKPTGTLQDDVMIAVISVRGGTGTTITPPAGWTLINSNDSTTVLKSSVYRKTAGSGESGPYVFTFSSSQKASGVISSYSGVDISAPVDVHSSQVNASSTTMTSPAVTTTVANTWVIAAFSTATGTAVTPGSSMTERGEASSTGGGAGTRTTSQLQDITQAGTGTTGTKTATAGGAGENIGHTIALTPLPEFQLTQANYRWFANADSAAPGSALSAQDSSATVTVGAPFRLRQRIAVDSQTMGASSQNLKLQFAEKSGTCDTGFSGETYSDVNSSGASSVTTYNGSNSATVFGDTTYSTWTSASNILTEADAGASASTSFNMNGGYSSTLRMTANPPAIPSNATITGFRVGHNGLYGGDGAVYGTLVIDGTPRGTQNSLSLSTLPNTFYTGNSSDLWGASWTAAELNATTAFGIDLNAYLDDGFGAPAVSLDHVFIEIYYTAPNPVAYYNNASPTSGATISSNGSDPTNGARPTVYQTYNETDPYINSVASVASGSDGIWDFALTSDSGSVGKTYCFRTIKANGSLLDTYSNLPEITFTSAAPTVEQVTRGGGGVLNGVKQNLTW